MPWRLPHNCSVSTCTRRMAVLQDAPLDARSAPHSRRSRCACTSTMCAPSKRMPTAHGALGGSRLSALAPERVRIDCDCLLISTGWMPALQLALQAGAVAAIRRRAVAVPALEAAARTVRRRPRAWLLEFAARARDGRHAGAAAALHAARRGRRDCPTACEAPQAIEHHPHPLFPHPQGKEFVDLDEDLTLADLANAAQEGFDSVELLKRYSTVGMGPSQGKLSHLNAARQLARTTSRPLSAIGLTTARPPWQPISLGALAGTPHSPLRRTPMDAWHEAHGADWMPAGSWRRPAWYAAGEPQREGRDRGRSRQRAHRGGSHRRLDARQDRRAGTRRRRRCSNGCTRTLCRSRHRPHPLRRDAR